MINRTILVGRLVRDPELKYTQTGKAVSSFTIAVNRPFKTNGQQEADFINCTIWGKSAENLANYQRKGNLIGIDGRIQTRSYENQEGKKIFVTEVVADNVQFLESKNRDNNTDNRDKSALEQEGTQTDIPDDELPF